MFMEAIYEYFVNGKNLVLKLITWLFDFILSLGKLINSSDNEFIYNNYHLICNILD